MAIEQIDGKIAKEWEEKKKMESNTVHGCHIRPENEKVVVTIPGNPTKFYEFPKREIREILEHLYTS